MTGGMFYHICSVWSNVNYIRILSLVLFCGTLLPFYSAIDHGQHSPPPWKTPTIVDDQSNNILNHYRHMFSHERTPITRTFYSRPWGMSGLRDTVLEHNELEDDEDNAGDVDYFDSNHRHHEYEDDDVDCQYTDSDEMNGDDGFIRAKASPFDKYFRPPKSTVVPPLHYPSLKTLFPQQEFQYHGTTTIAFKYNGSIILCVDSKASMDTFIGSRTVKKVIPVSKHIVATMAGGAADCAALIQEVSARKRQLEIELDEEVGVVAVARMLNGILRELRGQEISVGTMIAGWDALKGAQLFYLDDSGSLVESDLFCVGSGAVVAYSVLDTVEKLEKLTKDKAIDTAMWAVKHASYRDGFSGGYLNIVEVNSTGIFHLKRVDVRTLVV